MQLYEYKGFTIYPTPYLSLDSDDWMISLTIRFGNRTKSFSSEISFSTEGEATFHSILYGKKIINGEIDEYSVDDML